MKSMIRYCLPVHVLLLLAVLELCSRRPCPPALARRRIGWLALGLVILGVLQAALAWRFMTDRWAA